MAELTSVVARCLELLDVREPPERYVTLLREHISTVGVSQHLALHSRTKVVQRAPTAEAGDRFAVLHDDLRARGVHELDRLTLFLQRVGEERAVLEMLRDTSASTGPLAAGQGQAGPPADQVGASAVGTAIDEQQHGPAAGSADARSPLGWDGGTALGGGIMGRPFLSGAYLVPGVREHLLGAAAEGAPFSLGALPVAQQEELLVEDLICVLSGVEGAHLRVAPAATQTSGSGGSSAPLGSSLAVSALPKVRFHLLSGDASPTGVGGQQQAASAARLDPSLAELVSRVLPLAEQYVHISQFAHLRSSQLSAGMVMHAFCAGLRACLKEHLVGVAQLQQQHRSQGLRCASAARAGVEAFITMHPRPSPLSPSPPQPAAGYSSSGTSSSPPPAQWPLSTRSSKTSSVPPMTAAAWSVAARRRLLLEATVVVPCCVCCI